MRLGTVAFIVLAAAGNMPLYFSIYKSYIKKIENKGDC
jgi:hypothetical protein